MNARQLQLDDGTKLNAWRCSVCGLIFSEREPYSSERCCKCIDCGAVVDPKVEKARSSLCRACWGPHYAKIDADRLERATELTDYAGPVVISGDRYYEDVDEFLDLRDGEDLPEFVHTCHVRNFTLDIDRAIESMVENAGVEDAPRFAGMAELRAAVEKFNEANKGLTYWEEDSKHKVRVRPSS